MTYDTPTALRQALEARLLQQSHDRRLDLTRLRRGVVFERMLVRLDAIEPGQWVMKGGMALEVRLGGRARMTRDLDLTLRSSGIEPPALRSRLIDVLGKDPEADRFTFIVGEPELLRIDTNIGGGVRFSIRALLAGREFAAVRIDVVPRPDEARRTERLTLPGALAFAGKPARTFEVVSPNQHFAEKLHALTRVYRDRENTRVWDLADLLLLIGERLVDELTLAATVRDVFNLRSTHDLPTEFRVPENWQEPYARLAADLELAETTLALALERLSAFWTQILEAEGK